MKKRKKNTREYLVALKNFLRKLSVCSIGVGSDERRFHSTFVDTRVQVLLHTSALVSTCTGRTLRRGDRKSVSYLYMRI